MTIQWINSLLIIRLLVVRLQMTILAPSSAVSRPWPPLRSTPALSAEDANVKTRVKQLTVEFCPLSSQLWDDDVGDDDDGVAAAAADGDDDDDNDSANYNNDNKILKVEEHKDDYDSYVDDDEIIIIFIHPTCTIPHQYHQIMFLREVDPLDPLINV
ncbi:hypothetical protein PoB_004842800 [Plakobranchus ocellatus]|uniref:Uncharacterized protein n=1 Tax=Plakobranchus ocellatus TaxID=259542 RepID=A0AAV4BQS2_9GAST|nr:hypothetical protein PoB_004842800 [Plakobranchus ocellatus]